MTTETKAALDRAIERAVDDRLAAQGLPQYGDHRKIVERHVRRSFEVGFRELGVTGDEAAVPGRMHPIDKAFYDLVVQQRDEAWATLATIREAAGVGENGE